MYLELLIITDHNNNEMVYYFFSHSDQKIEPPTFLKRIGDTELYAGMTAKFTACASGHPEPDVEWYRNDTKIFPSERIHMEKDLAGLLRLTIANVDEADLGKYSCKISNEYGNDICHANLTFDCKLSLYLYRSRKRSGRI